MKIVIATPVYPPEISETAIYIRNLATHIRDAHETTIITYANAVEDISGVKIIAIKKSRRLPVRMALYTIALFRISKGVDVISTYEILASGLPALIVGFLRQVPVVINFTEDDVWRRAEKLKLISDSDSNQEQTSTYPIRLRLMMYVQSFILRNANTITTPSTHHADIISKRYNVKRKKIMTHYPPPQQKEILRFSTQRKKHHLVTITKLTPEKNVDGIIQAVAHLNKKFPNIHLTIVGEGAKEESLKKLAHILEINDHVTFLGKVAPAQRQYLRETKSVFIINSHIEHCPRALIDSFATDIPVIATDIPCHREIIGNNESGILIPTADVIALTEAIRQVFTDNNLREKIVKQAQIKLKKSFVWEVHKKNLMDIIESTRKNGTK